MAARVRGVTGSSGGVPYYDVGLQLLSKYPILEPSEDDGLYALIEVQPGYVVAFFNTHLDYVAYGPKLLDSGMPVAAEVASEDQVRTSSMEVLLPHLNARPHGPARAGECARPARET